jgi:hypothetical protein
MPTTDAIRERGKTVQLAEGAETAAPSRRGKEVPAVRKGRLTTSGMSAGASATATVEEEKRANQQAPSAAMKQQLSSVTARLQ